MITRHDLYTPHDAEPSLQSAYKRWTEWNANNYGSTTDALRSTGLDVSWWWGNDGTDLVLEARHSGGGVIRIGDAHRALPEDISAHSGWSAAYYTADRAGERARYTTEDGSTAGLLELVRTLLDDVLNRAEP